MHVDLITLFNDMHTWYFFMLFCRLLIFFKINFSKKFFQEYQGLPWEYYMISERQTAWTLIRPDDSSDLGLNCLPWLSADDTGRQRAVGFHLTLSKARLGMQDKNILILV